MEEDKLNEILELVKANSETIKELKKQVEVKEEPKNEAPKEEPKVEDKPEEKESEEKENKKVERRIMLKALAEQTPVEQTEVVKVASLREMLKLSLGGR